MKTAKLLKFMTSTALAGSLAIASGAFAQDQATTPEATQVDDATVVIVTGSSIRGVAPTGSSLTSITKKEIEATGAKTTSELLATVPQLASFGTRPAPSSGGGSPSTSPSIHGLGSGATLNLMNGHRLPGVGAIGTSADPSFIPPGMIERVEVVADGASSIYGSDAVAGVINVILQKRFNGLSLSYDKGYANHYEEENANLVAGKTWADGAVLFGGQWASNTNLLGRYRSWDTTNLTSIGGVDARSTQSPDANVVIAGINYAGPAFLPNTTSLYDAAKDTDLIPAEKRNSYVLNFNQKITDNVRVYGDVIAITKKTAFLSSPAGTTFTLNNTNPYFRDLGTGATSETVNYRLSREMGNGLDSSEITASNIDLGVNFDINSNWQANIEYGYGKSTTAVNQHFLDQTALDAAVNSTNPNTALDPFGGLTNPAVSNLIGGRVETPGSDQQISDLTAKVDGRLFALGGGDVKLALGAEAREEDYKGFNIGNDSTGNYLNVHTSGVRKVTSAFAEVFLPFVGEANARPGLKLLSLSISGRFDHYSDFGNTSNPKFGLNYKPIDDLTVRASYGTSFHAPSQADLYALDTRVDVISQIVAPGFLTPPAGYGTGLPPVGTPWGVVLIAGGNADLKPETAKTSSFGADWKPSFAPGLSASATYFNIDYKNTIGITLGSMFKDPALDAAFMLVNPTDAEIAARTTGLRYSGSLSSITLPNRLFFDFRRYNLGENQTRGIDYNVAYRFKTSFASMNVGFAGTHYLAIKTKAFTGGAFSDNLETGAVKDRWRASWNMSRGVFNANVFVNYVGSYDNGAQTVKPFRTVDTNFDYTIDGEGFASGVKLVLDVENIFDEAPPIYVGTPSPGANGTWGGGNPGLASPLGRVISVGIRKAF
jgi:iron complex outermembrane receptor protein